MKEGFKYLYLPLVALIFLILNIAIKPSINTLYWLQPLSIFINIILIIVFTILARNNLKKYFQKIPKWVWGLLLLIFIFGLVVRLTLPPKEHRIYYDEDIYLNGANNIANQGLACLCDYGVPGECYDCIDNKQPMGMQTFNAIFIFLFGNSELFIFIIDIIVASLAIPAIFLLTRKLTNSNAAGLLSALFLSLVPDHILWSATLSQDAFFPTFFIFTAFLFLIFSNESFKEVLLAFLFAAFTIQIRTEGLLILPILGIFLLLKKPMNLLKDKRIFFASLVLVLLITPTIMHIMANSNDSWGAGEGGKFASEYFIENVSENSKYFFEINRFPILFTLFFAIGIAFLLKDNWRSALPLLSWFFAFFILYGFFYAGSFNYGMDVRFSLTMIPAFIILSSYGALKIWELIDNKIKRKNFRKYAMVLCLAFILIFTSINHLNQVTSFGPKANDARVVHEFAKEFAQNTSEDCMFISQVSSMFLNFNRASVQTHRFLWGEERQEIMDNFECIYFYWGYWCASTDEHRDQQCLPLLDELNWEYISQAQELDKTFVFYKLNKSENHHP